jgi:hypothetical protein
MYKPQFNNYFINVVKNLGAHLFMNCEAQSLYPYRSLLEEEQFTTCFNDYHDLMVAARVGKDGYVRQISGYKTSEEDTRPRYVSWAICEILWGTALNRDTHQEEPLTRGRMSMRRVCVYHVGQENISKSHGICGEIVACMSWECIRCPS